MKKRTKIFILIAMVLLLGVTGYLNIVLNNSTTETEPTVTTTASYFELYRSDRETTRDQELLYYQAIIDSATSEEAVASAKVAMEELLIKMETELLVENTIKGYGFTDCVVTSSNENVNVIVEAQSLTTSEVAQIVSVIQDELKTNIKNIKIIPVNWLINLAQIW